jgi:hypothetical protein
VSELAIVRPGVDAEPGSPLWWLRRLHTEITNRNLRTEIFEAYYCGDHPLPWLPSQAQAEFRRILRMTRSNYMGLVVDATAERLSVEGFRLAGEDGADEDTWRLWQANNLDADSDKGILEALIHGTAYTLVQPNGTDTPDIWIEHPSQTIVAYEAGSNRRKKAAGLKLWVDDWTGRLNATLYLPGWVYKFDAPQPRGGVLPKNLEWRERVVPGESWPARNTLGEVPLAELPNNPRLLTGGVSEIADVIDGQDRANKTLADRLITQDFGAFPQKWATAYPETDSDGNAVPPIDVGRDRIVSTDIAETKFGQWDAAPLDPYLNAKREDVKDIASRTRTPAQYLLGEMSNVNGETLKASESGLVAKVRQRMRSFSEGFEDTMRLARKAANLPTDVRMETLWRNPEFRTEAEITDAAVKQLASGIRDKRSAREFVGLSQTEIGDIEDREEAAMADPVLAQISRDLISAAGTPATSLPPTGATGATAPGVG